ncbi:MAG: hypothetical protein JSV40_02975 [Deltaproteobacteria bacterium]|nr:MAG: hypothetical protein JSV40_02975 [Deltaproteobacteria bacterium]
MKRGCGAAGPLDPACSARIPFAQLQFGGLKIAAGKPATGRVVDASGSWAAGPPQAQTFSTTIEQTLPKLMASYNLNVANVGLKLFGGYNTYEEKVTATQQSYDIDSMVYGLTASAGFGPLTVKAMIWGGENTVEYGAGAPAFAAYFNSTTNQIEDSSILVYGLDLAYKVSDMVSVAAGYQTGESESDRTGTWEDETDTYFLNATITLAKGVTLTPEYAVVDLGDKIQNGVKSEETETTWIGVYWQINF